MKKEKKNILHLKWQHWKKNKVELIGHAYSMRGAFSD